jgi:hypothetical protein
MLLKQIFKTFEGAQKRAAFENALSKTHRFDIQKCHPDGEPDPYPHSPERRYCWRIIKTKRAK